MSWRVGAVVAAALIGGVVLARLLQDPGTGTSTWDASRAAGFTAYLLLWASAMAGMSLHLRLRPAGGPMTWLLEAHRVTSTLALSFVAAHVVALLLDPVVRFSVLDALVPFTSSYRTVQVGLGALSQWLLLIVLASTAFATALPWRAWRNVHYLSFPCYLLALVHGIVAGSDSGNTAALIVYAGTASAVAALAVARSFGRDWVPAEA
jgi:methionine sulfoxide reductase heme-binding subunit